MFNPLDISKKAKPVAPTVLSGAEKEQTLEKQSTKDKKVLEQEMTYRHGLSSVLDLIAPEAFEVQPDYVRMGDVYGRTIFLLSYPRYIAVGWFSPIINYSAALDVSMFFYPMKSEVVLKQLRNKVGVLEAQLMTDAEKGAPRDPLRETALRDIEKLRDDLTQGVEKFFQYALYITLYEKDKKALDQLTEDVEAE
ncbi:MAG: conjugal transfer protein TraC, partial [Parcubacteria group bacterium]